MRLGFPREGYFASQHLVGPRELCCFARMAEANVSLFVLLMAEAVSLLSTAYHGLADS